MSKTASDAECAWPCSPQLLTKAGILNVPEWYEAGKVYAESKDAIPICESSVVRRSSSAPWPIMDV